MSSTIDDYSGKVRLVIGHLMSQADDISKTVLTAYDNSKDRPVNSKVLGGAKFQVPSLDACAKFLGIPTLDAGDVRIFPNKPALAMRIIMEIESLFPNICGECNEEYCNEFGSANSPALRCFLCFQGSHDCHQFTDKVGKMPDDFPNGSVWLCHGCNVANNPVPSKRKGRSRHVSFSDKSTSAAHSLPQTPVEDSTTGFSTQELTEKLAAVQKQQESSGSNSRPSDDSVCEALKAGKCPHGISGRTLHNGVQCSKLHPKRCRRFTRFGPDSKRGCALGSNCQRYHVKHCKNSVQHKQCINEQCTLVHLVGTARTKRKHQPNKDRRSRELPPSRCSEQDYRRREDSISGNRPPRDSSKSRGKTEQPSSNSPDSFLEIQTLLKVMKGDFQKELAALKDQISGQESKLSSMFPTANQTPYPQMFPGPMFPHPPAPGLQAPSKIPPWSHYPPSCF